jgi:lipoprotein-anchoring transpeptidase ErfK/SrfK
VFRDKHATKEIWKRGDPVKEDLILTRVLTLRGEEPGKNKGGDVDSFDRNIYIHGTNDEEKIGTPASHGCVRLTNDDVITLYEMVPLNTPMLITEE